jgi:predicted nucleic acid-binding protein
MKILLDTNILLRWLGPENPDHILLVAILERLLAEQKELCYTSQNLGEFWNTLTRPIERNGFGLSPALADRRAHSIETRLTLLPDLPSIHTVWRQLLVKCEISGVQVHDARLAASMYVHGVKHILTFNARDFSRFDGIKAIAPAQRS